MAELKIFYKDNEKIKVARTISALKQLDKKDIIWIDLLDVSDKTEDTLEGFLKIDIQEDEEMEEIRRTIDADGELIE
jgi:magnesium transporter